MNAAPPTGPPARIDRTGPERTTMSTTEPTTETLATEPLLATTVPAPAGLLAFVLTPEDGVVRAAGFTPITDVASRLPAVLSVRGVRTVEPAEVADHPTLATVVAAVRAYAAGDLGALDAVPVAQPGGPFFQQAWAAMRAIPAGTTSTYTELAAAAGSPLAVRAAGSACARNLLAPFVPCHRVLRTGGLLGGYYFGLDVKRALLEHEGAPAAEALVSRPAAAGRSA
jgi:methylated-DNA-[protein]-cysteine S-methyltransferase